MLDLSSKLVYECAGECRVESRLDGVAMECTAWKQDDRNATCAGARFLGNGVWIHRPGALTGAPGN